MIAHGRDSEEMLPPFGWDRLVTQWTFTPLVTGLAATAAAGYL